MSSGAHVRHNVPGLRLSLLSKILVLTLMAFLGGCSFIPRESFTADEEAIAEVEGIPGARFWADSRYEIVSGLLGRDDVARYVRASGNRFDILALSGGAYDGAFGAGVINGWTKTGARPKFAMVSGVSAGSLIAPFAFLGPEYDPVLTEAFTRAAADILGDLGGLFSLLGSPDVRRETLVNLIDNFVTPQLMDAVAREHAKGRRLLVVTTNLDAQRTVVWNMGVIASSRNPKARQLFRDVLTASSSIPGLFAPTYIEVTANGHTFKEMHVDGGATTQVFVVPDAFLIAGRSGVVPGGSQRHAWIIINNHLTPQFEVVESGILPTIGRSFSTLIKNSAKSTLLATSEYVGKTSFNLTYIDDGFDVQLKKTYGDNIKPGFNAEYMQAAYKYGYDKAVSGQLWTHEVPLPGGGHTSSLRALMRQ